MAHMGDREFADALRDAIDARGLSLDRVRAHLLVYGHDVSVATLSYWQTGRSRPVRRASLQALGALEAILQVPRGSLASKLPSPHSGRPAPGAGQPGIPAIDEVLARISAELGVGLGEGYDVVTEDHTVTVDAARQCSELVTDTVLFATRDGLDRLLVDYRSDVPGVLVGVHDVIGGRLGRTATVLTETLTVTEILLDQTLRAGEPYRLQVRAVFDTPGVLVRECMRLVPCPTRATSLTLSFPPDDMPACRLYTGPFHGQMRHRPVTPAGSEFTIVRTDFGPGVIACQWAWPDDAEGLIQPVRDLVEGAS